MSRSISSQETPPKVPRVLFKPPQPKYRHGSIIHGEDGINRKVTSFKFVSQGSSYVYGWEGLNFKDSKGAASENYLLSIDQTSPCSN